MREPIKQGDKAKHQLVNTGIYTISTPDGRQYVGSSVNIRRRWMCHISDIKGLKHHSKKLQSAAEECGVDNLVFSIIAQCKKEHLRFLEQSAMEILNPSLNTTLNARCPMHDPEVHAKLMRTLSSPSAKANRVAASKRNWMEPAYRENVKKAMEVCQQAEAYRNAMALTQKDRRAKPSEVDKYKKIHSDPAYRMHQSEVAKLASLRPDVVEHRNSSEFKEAHNKALRIALSTPEYKEKASAARKAVWANPEFKEARLAAIRKMTSSPEYREKMSKAVKAAKARKKGEQHD